MWLTKKQLNTFKLEHKYKFTIQAMTDNFYNRWLYEIRLTGLLHERYYSTNIIECMGLSTSL